MNRGIKVLQTFALPLGYDAGYSDIKEKSAPMVEVIGIEPMTLCL